MPNGRTNNFFESGRGLGHVTPTIFGSTVGYPSDSLAFCCVMKQYLTPFHIHVHLCASVAICELRIVTDSKLRTIDDKPSGCNVLRLSG